MTDLYKDCTSREEAKAVYQTDLEGHRTNTRAWIWTESIRSIIDALAAPYDELYLMFADWHAQIAQHEWRQGLYNELTLILTGVVPEGQRVPVQAMRFAVWAKRDDLIQAFLPHYDGPDVSC